MLNFFERYLSIWMSLYIFLYNFKLAKDIETECWSSKSCDFPWAPYSECYLINLFSFWSYFLFSSCKCWPFALSLVCHQPWRVGFSQSHRLEVWVLHNPQKWPHKWQNWYVQSKLSDTCYISILTKLYRPHTFLKVRDRFLGVFGDHNNCGPKLLLWRI